jgi:hypothetical protein
VSSYTTRAGLQPSSLAVKEPELDFDSQQHTKAVLIQQLIGQVNEALAVLTRQTVPTLVPKASTA